MVIKINIPFLYSIVNFWGRFHNDGKSPESPIKKIASEKVQKRAREGPDQDEETF